MKHLLVLLFITSVAFSQKTDKIKVNYLSFGIGVYTQQHFKNKGITSNIDLSFSYKKNMIILYTALGIVGNDKPNIFIFDSFNSFYELDILYGKEFEITDWLKTEGQIGIGTFRQNNSIDEESKTTIGFPFRAKLLFYPTKKFAVGFNPNCNINSANIIFSYNLIFQFKF